MRPCESCHIRKWLAREFDTHIWGDDCPYECEKYKRWRGVKEDK